MNFMNEESAKIVDMKGKCHRWVEVHVTEISRVITPEQQKRYKSKNSNQL